MQQRALKTQAAILKAAKREFSAKGFHGARVDAIAAAAAVNKQRIYAYFRHKAGLFTAVLQACFYDMEQEEQRLLQLTEADVPTLADLILDRYVRIHEKHPELWRLLAWENLDGGQHADALTGIKEPVFQHLRGLYGAGQVRGIFRLEVPFEAFIFNLLAVSYFMVSNQHTLRRTLGLDLSQPSVRYALSHDVIRQLSHGS